MARKGIINLLGGATLALALSASGAAFAAFEGFGKDIPLESAAKQIAPSGWAIDYGQGVDPKTPISWGSANDWQSALRNAVSKKGLNAQFGSNTVIIAKDAKASSSERTYSSAPRDEKPASSPKKPAKPAPKPAARREAANPVQPEPIQGGGGFTIRPYRGGSSAEKAASNVPSTGLATKGESFEPYAAPAPAFTVNAGQMLRPVLAEWAASAGWRLIWESEYDYRIEADASFGSDFVKAVTELATAMSSARPAITIDFYNGNNVLVVSNKSADAVN